jgi:superfamily II DNA or RNA helicase
VAREGAWRSRLWPHQTAALGIIRRYLRANPAAAGSALIRMPTGTGKSGVIAITAHHLIEGGHVLVLAPWDALVEQLLRDITTRFWARIGVPAPARRLAVRLFPSTVAGVLQAAAGPTILVTTIKTLEDLHSDADRSLYEQLAASVAAVLVDEGHYEPAPSWSRAVRELGKPVVLFTATPYRNDFHYFAVNPGYFYAYSHQDAEAAHFIRRVSFADARWSSPRTFVRELLAFCGRRFPRGQPRVIVRCATESGVRDITGALVAAGRSVVGVHENFGTGDTILRRSVPNADDPGSAQFWVQQPGVPGTRGLPIDAQ